MVLDADVAQKVIDQCSDRDLAIIRVEGGFVHEHEFEARLDCIWDGIDTLVTFKQLRDNNEKAKQFVEIEKSDHNGFVLTVAQNTE
jgi:hypothetical protein